MHEKRKPPRHIYHEDIEYYNSFVPLPDTDPDGNPVPSGPSGPTNNPSSDPEISQIVEGLKIGEIRKPKLGNIFGTTWVTDDKYEDRRRVKVKFYSQDLWLVYAIGCKVKHQYKGWTGTWRKENADKFSKKKLTMEKDSNENLYITKVE